ncbi:solute carrier family 22 member 7-like [Saccostrea echinata]|uniref:solute carrier family 22 member 7-like n=1 Tax=Saccostrea echinata TaxID=191078 RepID=UPI002A8203AB|nr:solute carrier family 22 member 7-like [Saccostrea echinata]
MDVDDTLRSLGKYGRFQILQYVYTLICSPSAAYPLVIYVFIGYIPDFQCKFPSDLLTNYYRETNGSQNVTMYTRQCDVILETNRSGVVTQDILPCTDGYDFFGRETTISEWNLVCQSEGLGSMPSTMVAVGQMIGASLFTALSDKYGRLVVTYTTFIGTSVCFILTAVVPWFFGFVILRLLTGAFAQGFGLVLATIQVELFPAESRGFVSFVGNLMWTFSISSIALIAYLLRSVSWRYTMLTAGLVGVHSLGTRWILKESPRWLVVNGRYEEAKVWIRKAAKWNRKDAAIILADLNLALENGNVQGHAENNTNTEILNSQINDVNERTENINLSSHLEEKLSVLDIFRNRRILITSVIVWIIWFVNSITYYGLFLTSGTMNGDMYLNFFLNGLVEIPSVFLYMFTINRYGRKKTCIMFHAIAGVCLSVSAVLMYLKASLVMEGFATAFSLVGKFGISGSWMTIFLYTEEVYPTNLRALGIGLASCSARIGAMISPYAALFGTHIPWGPGVVFGILSVLVTVLIIWLPETTGKELPNTLEEVNDLYVQKKDDQ